MLASVRKWVGMVRHYTQGALLPSVLIYIFGAFGAVCMSSTTVYLLEQAVCRTHYSQVQPALIKPGGLIDEEMCKIPEIQSQVASINGVYKVLAFLPALLLTGPWGRIAEVLGKRCVLLMNLSSSALGVLWFTSVCYFQLPIKLIYAGPLFDIFGGGNVIMSSFVYGFIAESVGPKSLTGILFKLSAAQLGIAFIGMTLSSWLLRTNVWVLNIMSFVSISLCVPTALLFPRTAKAVPQAHIYVPPALREGTAADLLDARAAAPASKDAVTSDVNISVQESSETTSLLSNSTSSSPAKENTRFLNSSAASSSAYSEPTSVLKTIFHALTTQYLHSLSIFYDMFNSSPLARTTLFTYFVIVLCLNINVTFVQWASVTFGWLIADVNAITSFEMIVSGAVLTLLPILTHKFLYPKLNHDTWRVDIFVAKASVVVHAIGIIGMGFAPNKIAYIAATTIWTIGIGWNDSLRSFVTGMVVDKDEIDKLYLGIGMIETCAAMVGTAAWSAAYSQLVDQSWFVRRILFIIAGWMMLVSLPGMIGMERFAKAKFRAAMEV